MTSRRGAGQIAKDETSVRLEIYNMAGHLIRRLNQITASVFQNRMHEHGVDLTSVQFAALSAINAYPAIDQATLAGVIAYDRATITGVLDRLEAKGFVARKVSQRDRRLKEIFVTDLGKEVLTTTIPTVRALQNEILGGLTVEERETFIRLARKAADAGNLLSRAPLVLPGDKARARQAPED